VTAASNIRENVIRCVQKADVEVDDLVFSPLAAAEAVLTEQEKNMGVVLVDIGHGTTDIAVYVEGSVWHTRVIPVGGWHLTNDLVYVFKIPYEAAEALKLQHGRAAVPGSNPLEVEVKQHVNGKSHPVGVPVGAPASGGGKAPHMNGLSDHSGDEAEEHTLAPGDEMLEARTFEDTRRLIPRSELNDVMAARFDQLFGLIGDEIRRSGYEGLLPAGVVLAGGVAQMPGTEQVASSLLRMPVRIGHPQRIGGLADAFDSPAYATSVGLALWGFKQGASTPTSLPSGPSRQPRTEQGEGFLAKWLKSFLPKG
jgi:cell division protein FtsA